MVPEYLPGELQLESKKKKKKKKISISARGQNLRCCTGLHHVDDRINDFYCDSISPQYFQTFLPVDWIKRPTGKRDKSWEVFRFNSIYQSTWSICSTVDPLSETILSQLWVSMRSEPIKKHPVVDFSPHCHQCDAFVFWCTAQISLLMEWQNSPFQPHIGYVSVIGSYTLQVIDHWNIQASIPLLEYHRVQSPCSFGSIFMASRSSVIVKSPVLMGKASNTLVIGWPSTTGGCASSRAKCSFHNFIRSLDS